MKFLLFLCFVCLPCWAIIANCPQSQFCIASNDWLTVPSLCVDNNSTKFEFPSPSVPTPHFSNTTAFWILNWNLDSNSVSFDVRFQVEVFPQGDTIDVLCGIGNYPNIILSSLSTAVDNEVKFSFLYNGTSVSNSNFGLFCQVNNISPMGQVAFNCIELIANNDSDFLFSSRVVKGLLGVTAFFAIFFSLLIICVGWRRKKNKEIPVDLPGKKPEGKVPVDDLITSENFLSDIEFKEKVNDENNGEVYQGTWKSTTQVLLKNIPNAKMRRRELLNLKMNHPNIVRCLGITKRGNDRFLVTEYFPKGTLSQFLKNEDVRKNATDTDLLLLALDIVSGMSYLEINSIVHTRLKSSNLYISLENGRFTVKVGEFGFGSPMGPKWSAPEVLKTTKSDIWSFGVVLWEIYSLGEAPFGSSSDSEVAVKIKGGERLQQPPRCPMAIYELMKQCFMIFQAKRPTWSELRNEMNNIAKSAKEEESNLSMHVMV